MEACIYSMIPSYHTCVISILYWNCLLFIGSICMLSLHVTVGMFTLDHEHLNIWLRKTGFWNNKCTGDGPNILTNKSIWNLIMDKGRNISGVLSCSKLMLHFCTRSGKKIVSSSSLFIINRLLGNLFRGQLLPWMTTSDVYPWFRNETWNELRCTLQQFVLQGSLKRKFVVTTTCLRCSF